MPYRISGKGDGLGCKEGYAVYNADNGKVMGCHPTRLDAEKQIAALHANVMDAKADDSALSTYPGVGIKRPSQGVASTSGGTTGSNIKSKYGKRPKKKRRGRSPDASNGSAGAIGAGGTSMGAL